MSHNAKRSRILIPRKRWTPIRMEVFTNVLHGLEELHAGALFLIMYDRVRHRDSRILVASKAELARWTGLNSRTLNQCLSELRQKGLVLRRKGGVKHSRTNKPQWRVPLAEFVPENESWVPCPRFLICKYLKVFPNAVLLTLLLRYQHIGWQNHCWPGVSKLAEVLNWSRSRVCSTIRTMSDTSLWEARGTGLPLPLKVFWHRQTRDWTQRHFQVLAVQYDRVAAKRGESTLTVAPPFARRFRIARATNRNESTHSVL